MPELPEVEVIRRGLARRITGKTFAEPQLHFPGAVHHPHPGKFKADLPGRRVAAVGRRGKYLVLALDRGELVVHLRMTGRLVYCPRGRPLETERYLRLALPFTDGSALYFSDMRKFGGLWLFENADYSASPGLQNLGPDIFEQVTPEYFREIIKENGRRSIKSLLLDQKKLAGLGNIYVDESLFRSGIHPARAAGSLSETDIESLYRSIRQILQEAIRHGGTSTSDYRNAAGEQGLFQNRLAVYGLKGQPCPACGRTIIRIKAASRGTYLCPRCQPDQ